MAIVVTVPVDGGFEKVTYEWADGGFEIDKESGTLCVMFLNEWGKEKVRVAYNRDAWTSVDWAPPVIDMYIFLSTADMDAIEFRLVEWEEGGRAKGQVWLNDSELKCGSILSDPVKSPDDPAIKSYVERDNS